MAESIKARKVSRRKAMAILGSGAAVGAVWESSAELEAISCSDPAFVQVFKPPKARATPRGGTTPPKTGTTPPAKPENGVFVSFSCCDETRLAILTGAAKGSATGRTHLEPITKKLNEVGTDGLEEYCLMIWGLNKEHRDELVRTMTEKTTVWYGK
jgi:hypothetical protein